MLKLQPRPPPIQLIFKCHSQDDPKIIEATDLVDMTFKYHKNT